MRPRRRRCPSRLRCYTTLWRGKRVSSISSLIGTTRSVGYSQAQRQFTKVVAQRVDHPVRIKPILSLSYAHGHRRTDPHPASVWPLTADRAAVVDAIRQSGLSCSYSCLLFLQYFLFSLLHHAVPQSGGSGRSLFTAERSSSCLSVGYDSPYRYSCAWCYCQRG